MFYIKLLVWLFFVIVTLFIGCVPLFMLALAYPYIKAMEANRKPVKWMNDCRPIKPRRRYEDYKNVSKKAKCSNKSEKDI